MSNDRDQVRVIIDAVKIDFRFHFVLDASPAFLEFLNRLLDGGDTAALTALAEVEEANNASTQARIDDLLSHLKGE